MTEERDYRVQDARIGDSTPITARSLFGHFWRTLVADLTPGIRENPAKLEAIFRVSQAAFLSAVSLMGALIRRAACPPPEQSRDPVEHLESLMEQTDGIRRVIVETEYVMRQGGFDFGEFDGEYGYRG